MKTGVCISGPACTDRKRIATPHAHSRPTVLKITASPYIPNTSTPLPPICIPKTSAVMVSTPAIIVQRASAAIA